MNYGEKYGEGGVAVLESALFTIILAILGFGAAGMVGYLFEIQSVRAIVDEDCISTEIRPYLLETSEDGRAHLTLDSAQLHKLLDSTRIAILGRIESAGAFGGRSFVEAGYIVAQIDPETGRFHRFVGGPAIIRSSGSPPAQEMSDCPELLEQFRRVSEQGAGEASLLAIPSAIHSIRGAHNFLPLSVLIGVRAVKDLRGTAAGALLDIIRGETIVSGCKAEVLRGDVG